MASGSLCYIFKCIFFINLQLVKFFCTVNISDIFCNLFCNLFFLGFYCGQKQEELIMCNAH